MCQQKISADDCAIRHTLEKAKSEPRSKYRRDDVARKDRLLLFPDNIMSFRSREVSSRIIGKLLRIHGMQDQEVVWPP